MSVPVHINEHSHMNDSTIVAYRLGVSTRTARTYMYMLLRVGRQFGSRDPRLEREQREACVVWIYTKPAKVLYWTITSSASLHLPQICTQRVYSEDNKDWTI